MERPFKKKNQEIPIKIFSLGNQLAHASLQTISQKDQSYETMSIQQVLYEVVCPSHMVVLHLTMHYFYTNYIKDKWITMWLFIMKLKYMLNISFIYHKCGNEY